MFQSARVKVGAYWGQPFFAMFRFFVCRAELREGVKRDDRKLSGGSFG